MGSFYVKEKDIITNIVISFRDNGEVDRVSYDLPMDYLTFVRYFAYDGLVQVLSKQNNGDKISYHTLYWVLCKIPDIFQDGSDYLQRRRVGLGPHHEPRHELF